MLYIIYISLNYIILYIYIYIYVNTFFYSILKKDVQS